MHVRDWEWLQVVKINLTDGYYLTALPILWKGHEGGSNI